MKYTERKSRSARLRTPASDTYSKFSAMLPAITFRPLDVLAAPLVATRAVCEAEGTGQLYKG